MLHRKLIEEPTNENFFWVSHEMNVKDALNVVKAFCQSSWSASTCWTNNLLEICLTSKWNYCIEASNLYSPSTSNKTVLPFNVFYSSLVSLLSEIELFWNFEKATKCYPMQSVKLHPSLTSLTWQSMMFSVFQHRFVNCQSSAPILSQSKSSKQDNLN